MPVFGAVCQEGPASPHWGGGQAWTKTGERGFLKIGAMHSKIGASLQLQACTYQFCPSSLFTKGRVASLGFRDVQETVSMWWFLFEFHSAAVSVWFGLDNCFRLVHLLHLQGQG